MPLDSGHHSSSARFSGFADDLYYAKDAFRERLHFLFSQIEKEFDTLYMENVSREFYCYLTSGKLPPTSSSASHHQLNTK